ncbi:unique cartilage matrix-associated protein-like [Anguilla anguilla]|uniref:unique cartilage matrix-associated protein-like n=1 Tax=Anguilla anguilla TaxID=7936 RepID=UPI0015AB8152|nr:unique cartilage matrix-associated protein-like [Anguilla anguilla]
MSWTRPVTLALLAALLVLTLSRGSQGAAVRDDPADTETGAPQGAARRVFMAEAEAANFFRRRSRRTAKSQAEINAEQRQRLAVDERRREYHEEQRNEFENYAEEERDEQNERTREKVEQWREFHYDGLYPSYQYNRHHV